MTKIKTGIIETPKKSGRKTGTETRKATGKATNTDKIADPAATISKRTIKTEPKTPAEEFIFNRLPGLLEEKLSDLPLKQIYAAYVPKNNGVKLLGIHMELENCNSAPCLYVEPYMPSDPEELRSPSCIEQIVDRIGQVLRHSAEVVQNGLGDIFPDKPDINRLELMVVNRERNRELLDTCPYREFLDLAIILNWVVDCGGDRGVVHINQQILKHWESSFDELYPLALENMQRKHPAYIDSLDHMIEDMLGDAGHMLLPPGESPFYILSLKDTTKGAVALIYPGMAERLAELLGGSYYLIPSSINEFLILPLDFPVARENLVQMIEEVNREVLRQDEFLSNNLYEYRIEDDGLFISDILTAHN